MKIKKIGILTSGGDAPGMNSALFGVYSACRDNNIKLIGFIGGYDGLIDNKFVEIDFDILDGRQNRGGSIIKCSRSPKFLKDNYFKKALKNIAEHKLDAIIVLGGDGSIRGASALENANIKCICLPCTIDNDLNFTHTLGYDTATNNIVNAIDNISDSISSFGYGSVIKIMGRDCPDLLDSVASAIHTDLVVKTPDYNINDLIKKIKNTRDNQHLAPIVLVLESCADCEYLARILQEKCKFQWRAHILGYIQRGGTPTAYDRKYGYLAGFTAVKCIMNKESGFTIGMDKDELVKKSFENTFRNR